MRHEPIKHSGFAVLFITLSYFEMIGRYRAGDCTDTKSGRFFKEGVRSVFPGLDTLKNPGWAELLLADLYKKVRCGLYHVAALGQNVVLIGGIPEVFRYDAGRQILVINPHHVPPLLRVNLDDYRDELRDPASLAVRANFETRLDFDNP